MSVWKEIVDFTFTANETSRAFTGLNITKDDFIKIVFTHFEGSNGSTTVSCFPNTTAGVGGFSSQSNYSYQFLEGLANSTSASRSSENVICQTMFGQRSLSIIYFKLSENGKANFFSTHNKEIGSLISTIFGYTTSSNLTFNDPINSLTFTASASNRLATGSRIQIYRFDIETGTNSMKVADIITTTVTGSVVIDGLNIGKDNEFLLVSDINGGGTNNTFYELFFNNNTSSVSGQYRSQLLVADGSSTNASTLASSPRFTANSGLRRSVTYTHIKLSEGGIYTYQSYSLRHTGTTTPILEQNFGSFVTENIESITRLVISRDFNGSNIGSDSRFMLYKLK
jgi:hypothetical protein